MKSEYVSPDRSAPCVGSAENLHFRRHVFCTMLNSHSEPAEQTDQITPGEILVSLGLALWDFLLSKDCDFPPLSMSSPIFHFFLLFPLQLLPV